jgi:hypothetical protein
MPPKPKAEPWIGQKWWFWTLIGVGTFLMPIITIAAVAVPLYVNQRHKADESAVRSDLRILASEVQTWWVDETTPPELDIRVGEWGDRVYYMEDPDHVWGYEVTRVSGAVDQDSLMLTGDGQDNWCVSLAGTRGDVHRMTAARGLEDGLDCSDP